jgi:long-chain acyl-CoA synthetase
MMHPGLGILLEHQPALVVPAHIAGAHEALPPGRFLPRLHRISITFGEAVKSETLKREGKGDEPGERITQALEKRLKGLARVKGVTH